MELLVQLIIQGLVVIVLLREVEAPRVVGVAPDGHKVIDDVDGVVLDSRVEDLQGPALEALEGILFLGAALEELAVIATRAREVKGEWAQQAHQA